MKPKRFVIGIVVAIAAGVGVYALIRSHSAESAPEEEAGASVVTVQTGALKRVTLHRYITGYGTVEPAVATATQPAADAPLAAASAGVVAKVNVVEGQSVEKGDVLVELNSGSATAQFAEQQFERQKQLYQEHNTSQKALQDADAQLALLRIVAPISGTVVRLNVKPGAAVDVNTVVVQLMDLNRLVVTAGIPASESSELKSGQEVQVQMQPPVTATLSFVSPALDSSNGTVLIRAALPADSGLRPGQFVPLRIVTAIHTNCLAAPEESVVTDESGHAVVALVNGDQATQKSVQPGFRENGWVEITGADQTLSHMRQSLNLKEGDPVVTVGAYGLPEKTKVVVANQAGNEASSTHSEPSKAQ